MHGRASVGFAAVLFVLAVSLLVYMTVSYAQSYENGSMETSGAIPNNLSLSNNTASAGNESLNQSFQGGVRSPRL